MKINLLTKVLLLAFFVGTISIGKIVFLPQKIEYQLLINKQQSISNIAKELYSNNIIGNKRAFLVLLRVLHKDREVTAGLYNLKGSFSLWQLIQRITNGSPDKLSITIIEGWTFKELKHYINNVSNIKHLTTNMTEEEIKEFLKLNTPNLEGIFYPTTYYIVPNQTDLEIYQQAYKMMKNKLSQIYAKRSAVTNYISIYQLLIMASLIQKETSSAQDMFLVATVFNNRLKSHMRLQTDPAVFYGLSHKNKITRADFKIKTPYNTYLNIGLPPTPICIPSEKAIIAASQPLNKPDIFYFVAVGKGRTLFSQNYSQHTKIVNKYLRRKSN